MRQRQCISTEIKNNVKFWEYILKAEIYWLYLFGGKNYLIHDVYMECSVNITCIHIRYYSTSNTCFNNISVLLISCFLRLSCWRDICLNIVEIKYLYSTNTWYPAVRNSVRCWNILSSISLGYYILLSLYVVSRKIILDGFTVRFLLSDSLWSAILFLLQ